MALYLRKKLDNKAEIAVWQITETEKEVIELSSVPNDEMEEILLIRRGSRNWPCGPCSTRYSKRKCTSTITTTESRIWKTASPT